MEDETFEELFEEYLDEEEMAAKFENDLTEEEKKQRSLTDSPFTFQDTITINQFVNDFLEIPVDSKNLYHSGLKELGSSYVMGVDNDFANKNPELVYHQFLLIVLDAKYNRGTYVNPRYLKKLLEKDDLEKEFKLFNRKRLNDLKKLKEYCKMFERLSSEIATNEKFYNMLKETHKLGKYKKLIKTEERNKEVFKDLEKEKEEEGKEND